MNLSKITGSLWSHSIVPIQYCLAFGSFLWGMFLVWEGNTFDRQIYHTLAELFNEEIWGALFLVHFVLLMGHLVRPSEFPCWAKLIVSILGCVLWTSTHIALLMLPLPAAITPGIVLSVASWWVVVRTPSRNARRKTDRI